MLIAIDHGNYAIKTPRFTFVSGLTEHTVKPPMSDEILEYGGKFWTLASKRLPYMRDKTQDDRYFILTLFAIARELERKGQYSPTECIQLAVGLPPEHARHVVDIMCTIPEAIETRSIVPLHTTF